MSLLLEEYKLILAWLEGSGAIFSSVIFGKGATCYRHYFGLLKIIHSHILSWVIVYGLESNSNFESYLKDRPKSA